MGNSSNRFGRAYEYAWVSLLESEIENERNVVVVDNSSLKANRKAWNSMPEETKDTYMRSAKSALPTLLELEPLILEANAYADADTLVLESVKDEAGVAGDVRDIVIKCGAIEWEIGLSVKHNHEAVKHSRLSYKLDFGESWFGIPCSEKYWHDVSPIFDWLNEEKLRDTKWSALQSKEDDVYVPLLNAFIDEIKRAYKADAEVPRKMVEYLIGMSDYYKVISQDKKKLTIIRTFNIHGSLNQAIGQDRNSKNSDDGKVDSDGDYDNCVPIVELPNELIEIRFKPKSKTTVEMYLNNGWQLSFRIHNASSLVEPSLKFDIQFIGMPPTILSFECAWVEV